MTCSALEAPGDALPTEFRLFAAGANPTSKGVYVYDKAAQKAVMSQYASEGVELMIDLNHDSLDPAATASRSDAGDALGWFQLETKPDGSLWATDVRWNPEGERRLRAKAQRYISPAFNTEPLDDGSERVTSIANAALVAMPATHNAPALVAASKLPRIELAARLRAASILLTYRTHQARKVKR